MQPRLPKTTKEVVKLLKDLNKKPESFWLKRGEKMALGLFHDMSKRVPAYKDFLKKNKVRAEKIKNIEDFKNYVPTIDKNNYLRSYPLEKLCWDGQFSNDRFTISSTSGSTGEPFYFPRTKYQDEQYSIAAELYLLNNFSIDKKSTLYIDAFPLGPWIGGIFTYEAIRMVAERGEYPLSIYTAGINKREIIKAVKKFGDSFDQIIIGCYGPFLKDALDDGVVEGVEWTKYDIKFVFSAEGFSEKFREYVFNIVGSTDYLFGSLNHYGTVDLGTMSHETPLSIMTRRLALENNDLYHKIFNNSHKLPTLTQFLPEMFYFEEVDKGLLCSSYSGLPLVRYDLKDNGGVFTLSSMRESFEEVGLNLEKEIKKNKLKKNAWNLPFVYVYERNDFSVSLYAFQVYPETIRRGLQTDILKNIVSGKFCMHVEYDEKMNQKLVVNVELKGGAKKDGSVEELVGKMLTESLLWENSEFRKTYDELGARVEPRIILWNYEDPKFFTPGTKQKWVIKK